MGINTGSHDAGNKLYDPSQLYALSNWDTTRELMWAVADNAPEPIYPGDWTREEGVQVALSRVIRTPLPPEAAIWWTITASPFQVARNFPAPTTVVPLDESSVSAGLPSTPVQLVVKARGEEIFVDIGRGTEFSMLAGNIDVGLFIPSRIVKVNVDRRPNLYPSNAAAEGIAVPGGYGLVLPAGFDGTVYDTSISLNFTASKCNESTHIAPTCTRIYDPAETDVPAIGPAGEAVGGQAGDYQIPPRARRVRFAIGPEGTIPATNIGVRFLTDQANRTDLGELSNWAIGAGERFSPWVDVPGNAGIVNIADITAPLVTAIWELKL